MDNDDVMILIALAIVLWYLGTRSQPVGSVSTESTWFNPDTNQFEPIANVPWLPSRQLTRKECEALIDPNARFFRDPCAGLW